MSFINKMSGDPLAAADSSILAAALSNRSSVEI